MNEQELDRSLAAAYPLDRDRIERLEIESWEADLFADLDARASMPPTPTPGRPPRRRRRALAVAVAVATLAIALVAVILLAGGGAGPSSPAYGAQLIRFAESTPLLLLEGPGWGVRNVDQRAGGEGNIEFTRSSPDPHPDQPLMTRSDVKRHITPASVVERRQRVVTMTWLDARRYKVRWRGGRLGASFYDEYLHRRVRGHEPGRWLKTTIPGLGVTAYVDPRAESTPIQGGPGDRLMVAIWREGGHLIELRASVPDLAGLRERLGWLRRVGAEEWLDAMPAKVVKAAEYGATAKAMLRGIPLPPGFDPSAIPDLGLTMDRYQVGAAVGGAVACAWFDRWSEARAAGDTAAAREAEGVLLASERRWPIFREMSKEGAYPATVAEYAEHMRSGRWFGRPLLREAEQGLGCLRWDR
ncbi:MAG: hypothetical protein JSS68_20040 [Actinobacteria bacterium]|nr:hypothetical protein [Actinomycetota bacterium]